MPAIVSRAIVVLVAASIAEAIEEAAVLAGWAGTEQIEVIEPTSEAAPGQAVTVPGAPPAQTIGGAVQKAWIPEDNAVPRLEGFIAAGLIAARMVAASLAFSEPVKIG